MNRRHSGLPGTMWLARDNRRKLASPGFIRHAKDRAPSTTKAARADDPKSRAGWASGSPFEAVLKHETGPHEVSPKTEKS